MVLGALSASDAQQVRPGTAAMSVKGAPTSSRRITGECEDIAAKLGNPDWEVRVEAMERLQALVHGGGCASDGFMDAFVRHLREPLLAQCVDIRSGITKVACATVSCLSVSLGAAFGKVAELFVKSLAKQIRDGMVQVMLDDANDCVMTIIANVTTGRIIPALGQIYSGERSPVCRSHCMEYLAYIVQRWGAHVLRKHMGAVVKMITAGVEDAAPAARATSRECFVHLQERWPKEAARLKASLDPSSARQLDTHLKLRSGRAGQQITTLSRVPPPAAAVDSRSSTRASMSGPTRVNAATKPAERPAIGTAVRSAAEKCELATPPPDKTASASASRVVSSDTALPFDQEGQPATEQTTARRTKTARKEAPTKVSKAHAGDAEEDAHLTQALQGANNSHWSTRLESFRTLQELCATVSAHTVSKHFEALVAALVEHCNDGNEKVTVACLSTLGSYIRSWGNLFLESFIGRLLPQVLLKADGRTTKTVVDEALRQMQENCDTDAVLTALLKTFGHKNPNIQFACLDCLSGVLVAQPEHCSAYFGAHHMKAYVKVVLPFVKHKKPDFRRAAVSCLTELHRIAPQAFLARLRQRSPSDQRDVAAVLGPFVEELGIEQSESNGAAGDHRRARKAGLPSAKASDAATIIQSVARGRRGRKLSATMEEQSQQAAISSRDKSDRIIEVVSLIEVVSSPQICAYNRASQTLQPRLTRSWNKS
jgi:hypothetical protein